MTPQPGRDAARQQALLARLSAPGAWDGATAERIDTHISAVFLVGDRAWKIKKSVVLPFLDFGDASRREAACRKELALNRRAAPTLYLDVAPLIDPCSGETLDWAVVMRRFDQAQLLSVQAAAGPLDRRLVAALAEAVASFHLRAETCPRADADAVFAQVVEDNLAALAIDAALLGEARFAALTASLRAAVDQARPLLAARGQAGWVRRCHGDLHLGNICVFDGAPLLFDCIEFNDAFAVIDVAYDVAFLLMDLWRLGHGADACLAHGRWLEVTGDDAGAGLLPLFLAQRAMVRAMVVLATQGAAGGEAARAFVDLAVAALAPRPLRLCAVGGLSGSGKSTAARLIAAASPPPGAVILRSDVIRKQRAGVALSDTLPPEAYTKAASQAVYAAMFEQAAQLLTQGCNVVLDAVFSDPYERAAAEAAARQAGAGFAGFWLEADTDSRMARAAARTGDVSDATAEIAVRQADYDLGDLSAWTRIDSGGTKEETAALVRAAASLFFGTEGAIS